MSNTSAVTLLSSIHGRLRRGQRDIGKRDLQAAIKYGTKEPGYPSRSTGQPTWKFTYRHIVYITDETMRKEITSYVVALDIPEAPIQEGDLDLQRRAAMLLSQRPDLCLTHTVLVVDQSGSMKRCDVEEYKTRSEAVFGTIALDLLAEKLDAGLARPTDAVSLIEFREGDAEIVFEREPATTALFNRMARRRLEAQPRGNGNYIPALKAVHNLLDIDEDNETCPILVMFLSDGAPSDRERPCWQTSIRSSILDSVGTLAERFKKRLTFATIGFASTSDESFGLLQEMAEKATVHGANGLFKNSRSVAALGRMLTTLSATLTDTETQLTQIADGSSRTRRTVMEERYLGNSAQPSDGWKLFTSRPERWVYDSTKPRDFPWRKTALHSPRAAGFVKREKSFARGAERIVFEMREMTGKRMLLESKFVAKEALYVEDEQKKLSFHTTFARTQHRAAEHAMAFNEAIGQTLRRHKVPRQLHAQVQFLDCSVYTNTDASGYQVGFLVEKRLDHTQYKKWNDNRGTVNGNAPVASLQAFVQAGDNEKEQQREIAGSPAEPLDVSGLKAEDYPQAFSHFSYVHSTRRQLVCDLQGVLTKTSTGIIFELTDPVIHSTRGKKKHRRFGRTDHGDRGINKFFESHCCNTVCRLLGLPPSGTKK